MPYNDGHLGIPFLLKGDMPTTATPELVRMLDILKLHT